MRGIILSGHGNFASGLASAMKLIVGETSNLCAFDFLQDMTQEELESKFNEAISDTLKDCDEIIVLTDIMGGTPFKTGVMTSLTHKNIKLVSGVNLPFLLTLHFKLGEDKNVEEVLSEVIAEAKDSVALAEI